MQDRQRIVFLDFARVTACVLVILYHTCSDTSFTWYPELETVFFADESAHVWSSLFFIAGHVGVPLFFMISAWLLLPLGADENAFGFYRRRFARIIPPFLIFSVIYVFEPFIMGHASFVGQAGRLPHIPVNFTRTHLWYMYVLVGLYLTMPVISPWLSRATAREERMFIGLFALSTFVGLLHHQFENVWGEAGWNEFNALWYFSGYLGYMVTAHYIKVHLRWSARRRVVAGVITATVVFGILYAAYYRVMDKDTYNEFLSDWLLSYTSPLIVLLSVSVFLAFTGIGAVRVPRAVSEISRHSFGIYLLHRCVVADVATYLAFILPASFAFRVPMAAAISLVLSYGAVKAVSCLPYGRYIVGSSTRTALSRDAKKRQKSETQHLTQ